MRYQFSIAIFLALLLSSCSSYQYLNIDVLNPAKYSFQPEIKSIVLVDNSVPFRDSLVHKVKLPNQKFTMDTIWQDDFPSLAIKSLKEELDIRMFFDSVYVHKEPLKTNRKFKNRALSWSLVDSLCKKYNAETVVAFESYIYGTNIDVTKIGDGYLYGYLDANGAVFWRAYNILDEKLIYKEIQADTISWDAEGGSLESIARGIPSATVGLADLADYMGKRAANHLSPHWETQQRGFYDSGNYQFMEASEFVRNEKWGEAIKLWKYVFDHSNDKTKMKAAYNLALASEIYGDYESAKSWLDQSFHIVIRNSSRISMVNKSRILKYSKYIEERLKIVEDLKTQVGGFE